MTTAGFADTSRRSRALPAVVVSLFALVALADVLVIILYGNYRNVIEEAGVEVVFIPAGARDDAGEAPVGGRGVLSDGGRVMSGDGVVLAARNGDRVVLRAPGELRMRFRAADAGAFIRVEYACQEPNRDARCVVQVARVASRHGVDVVLRRELIRGRRTSGVFRHFLADHAGWFELSFRVNAAAVEGGFLIGLPEIVME